MIVFNWILDVLVWTRNVLVWLFKECFVKESAEERRIRESHEFDKLMMKHIESLFPFIENTNSLCSQLIEVLGKQKQETEFKVPIIGTMLKYLSPHTYNSKDRLAMKMKKSLTDYLVQCLHVTGTSIGWTNEYGVYIADPDLKILAAFLRETTWAYHQESDSVHDIQLFLNEVVLHTKEGQKLLRECLPLSEDVFRFVFQKYL